MLSASEVVAKAREFIGTPLGHQGRLKGRDGCVDCVGVVLCVAEELGILDAHGVKLLGSDYLNYGPQPTGNLVHEITKSRLIMKWEAEQGLPMAAIEPGHVLTIRNPAAACHAGIVSSLGSELGIIHAYPVGPARSGLRNRQRVAEHVLSHWRDRIEGIFVFPGVK